MRIRKSHLVYERVKKCFRCCGIRSIKKIQQEVETNPLSVLRQAIRGVTPDIAVKTRRVGGSTHQVSRVKTKSL